MGIIRCYVLYSLLGFHTGAIDQQEIKNGFDSTHRLAYIKPVSIGGKDFLGSNSTVGQNIPPNRKLSSRNVDREGTIEPGGMEDLLSIEHMQVQFFYDDPIFNIQRIHSREDRFKSNSLYSTDTFYGEANVNGSVTGALAMVRMTDRNGANVYSGSFTTNDIVYSIRTTEQGTTVTSINANNFSEELHIKRDTQYDSNTVIYIGNQAPSTPHFINNGDIVVDIMILYTRSAMCSFAQLPDSCKWSVQNEEKVFSSLYLNILQA
jgi:hypothetical protein